MEHCGVSILPGLEYVGALRRPAEATALMSLEEALYLEKCEGARWRDGEAFRRLLHSGGSDGRRALYLVHRFLACRRMREEISGAVLATRAAELEGRRVELTRERLALGDELDGMGRAAFLAWATLVHSPDPYERWRAADGLAEMYEQDGAVDLLIMMMNDKDDEARLAAVPLATSKPEVIQDTAPFLALRILRDGNPVLVSEAVAVLRHIVAENPGEENAFARSGRISSAAAMEWIGQHYDLSVLDNDRELKYWGVGGEVREADEAPAP
jgi:hypothetical protein